MMVISTTACSANNDDVSETQPQSPQSGTNADVPLVEVPDLRGYTLEALMLQFSNLGFTPLPIMVISDKPDNTVLSIEQMGQFVQTPLTIEVFISAGLPDWDSEDLSTPESPAEQRVFDIMEFGGISWLILEEEENQILLLSELILFDRAYNTEHVSVTWETSTLRSYLNNEFFYSFSPEDRARIAEIRVINGDRMYTNRILARSWPVPGGNDTDDRIFLLSHDEQKYYFENDNARKAYTAEDHPMHDTIGNDWWWWLRSPGSDNFNAAVITMGNDEHGYRVSREIGVRPALWLYLD